MYKNWKRYWEKSLDRRNSIRRAKAKWISVEELLLIEKEEQIKIDNWYRFCKTCNKWKDKLDWFWKSNWYCLECCSKRTKKSYSKDKQREYKIKKNYWITIEEYNLMLVNQNYSCAICNIHVSNLDRSLAVDHCHKTWKVRWLLCWNCNRFLWQIDDNIDTAYRLYEYLIAANRKK